ncbi:STAS domain-containing protein [Hahella sp. HN01]|nr:STAS domain-containing protein [Hahella sp. HN01]
MNIETAASAYDAFVTITIHGRFDISLCESFRKAYEGYSKETCFFIDLREIEQLDTSALGLLLRMRSYLGCGAKVVIVTKSPQIRDILSVSRLGQYFSIASTISPH